MRVPFHHSPQSQEPAEPRLATWTVRQKLVSLMAMLVAGIALSMYLIFPARLEAQAVETLAAKAATVAEMSVYTLAAALDFGNVDEVDEALAAALQFEDVQYAFVQSADGALVGAFVRDSVAAMPLLNTALPDGITPDGSAYHLHRPVRWRNKNLGHLYIGFSLDALRRSVQRGRMTVSVVSLLVLLLGTGAAFGIGVFITRPLGLMVETADAITRGDLSERASVTSKDEVGRLAASFNAMVDSLESTYEALQGSEARFRAVIENTTDVIMLVDPGGRFLYVSPSAREVLGYEPEELTARDALAFVHPDDRPIIKRDFLLGVRRRGVTLDAEARFQHKDGSWRFFSYRGKNLLDYAGVESLLVSARDITARKQEEFELVKAKEKAEEMVRLKDAFLTNMSHEIRTPITGILGATQILDEEIDDGLRQWVEVIVRSGKRLMDTLNSVLDLAQLEAGGLRIHREVIDLADEVHEAGRLLAPLARENVAFVTEIPEGSLLASIDRSGFHRIVNNLASNALKFTERGQVTLALEADAETVKLVVRDTGIGIAKEFLPKLFEEFKQESTGLNRSHEGNGLGLAITHRLTKLMDGTIEVESIKGVGTVFTVSFPRLEDAVLAAAPPAREAARTSGSETGVATAATGEAETDVLEDHSGPPRVLLVEDNPESRKIVERLLARRFEVESTADADGALACAARTAYRAVLMDINLGEGGDGVAVMKDLRRLPAYEHVPIIALTAYAMPGDDERLRKAGFTDYLSKPFTREDLLGRILMNITGSDAAQRRGAVRPPVGRDSAGFPLRTQA